MSSRFDDNWTPQQREELVRLVNEQAEAQIEGDAEMREMVDWAITACGLAPSPEAYRLVFLISAMLTAKGECS